MTPHSSAPSSRQSLRELGSGCPGGNGHQVQRVNLLLRMGIAGFPAMTFGPPHVHFGIPGLNTSQHFQRGAERLRNKCNIRKGRVLGDNPIDGHFELSLSGKHLNGQILRGKYLWKKV